MGVFITKNHLGHTLIDSRHMCMGLVKSGYMEQLPSRERRQIMYSNSNPDDINSYVPNGTFDSVHGFSVRAQCPLVYVAGRCLFMDMQRTGDVFTFSYAHASTSCRFYVFDLMRDLGGGPKLKLRTRDSVITLDSAQRPLNVAGKATPPAPPRVSTQFQGMGTGTCYPGGTLIDMSYGSSYYLANLVCEYKVPIGVSDCAANCPWSRGVAHTSRDPWWQSFSGRESAYGDGNSLVFISGTDAGSLMNPFFNQFGNPEFPGNGQYTFMGIPVDHYPMMTAIETNGIPIPFDITV